MTSDIEDTSSNNASDSEDITAAISSQSKKTDTPKLFFPVQTKCNDPSSIWHYYDRAEDHQSAKCRECNGIRRCGGGSTKGLREHLSRTHKDVWKKMSDSQPKKGVLATLT